MRHWSEKRIVTTSRAWMFLRLQFGLSIKRCESTNSSTFELRLVYMYGNTLVANRSDIFRVWGFFSTYCRTSKPLAAFRLYIQTLVRYQKKQMLFVLGLVSHLLVRYQASLAGLRIHDIFYFFWFMTTEIIITFISTTFLNICEWTTNTNLKLA